MNCVKKTYVSFSNPKYTINKERGEVKYRVEASFNPPYMAMINRVESLELRNKLKPYLDCGNQLKRVFITFAVCSKQDKFDEVLGKRIAESKAKVKAFNWARRLIRASNMFIAINLLETDEAIFKNCNYAWEHKLLHLNKLVNSVKNKEE